MTSAVPDQPVPGVVLAEAAGSAVEPVWLNDAGGVTYRIDDPASPRFIKFQPTDPEIALDVEAVRLQWARRFTVVPEVMSRGSDAGAQWLVTAAIDGRSAVAPEWIADPATAVRAVGRGLRTLHDALPVDECPWSWAPTDRIADARSRGLGVSLALEHAPEVDCLVVCHGDACCPNTLLTPDGDLAGHDDLGSLGVADRWADIAVAAMSTRWNYGPGWEDELFGAYGVEPDPMRIAYYRWLWGDT